MLLGPDSIVAVEWADLASEALPPDHLEVRIERMESGAARTERVLHAKGLGPASRETLARWREALLEEAMAAHSRRNRQTMSLKPSRRHRTHAS